MIRRFNYTGRKSLPRDRIRIAVSDGPPRTFDATWDLDDQSLPADACVYIEAFSSGSPLVERFRFGTVGKPQSPADRSLDGIPSDNVIFNFKVVDETEHVGRLIAIAEHISGTEGESGVRSILPILPEDLGQQVWRLNFTNGRVVLEVNKKIEGIKEKARHDRVFFALVYPQVVRQILGQILLVEESYDPDGALDDWRVQWLRWAIFWHPDRERPVVPEADKSKQDRCRWIEEVVGAFCERHAVRDKYVSPAGEEDS